MISARYETKVDKDVSKQREVLGKSKVALCRLRLSILKHNTELFIKNPRIRVNVKSEQTVLLT